MLPTRAPQRHHQVLESAALIVAHTGIDQRHHTGEILMHILLLVEIVNHRRIPAGERLEALLASRVWQAVVHQK